MTNSAEEEQHHQQHAFDGLPAAVIDRILRTVDPETYASLLLVNRAWRQRADVPGLYALHLFRSLPKSRQTRPPPVQVPQSDLSRLRRRFAQQTQYHFWAAYRPKAFAFRIVAPFVPTASASPLGDTIDYVFSPNGSWLAATTSSRVFVLQLRAEGPVLSRSFGIKKRPVATTISDDARIIAFLAYSKRVDIYNLDVGDPHLAISFELSNPATAIALAPNCSIFAAGSSTGVEVVSLRPSSEDANAQYTDLLKRSIHSPPVDSVTFSPNGRALLATSLGAGATTVIQAPPGDGFLDSHSGDLHALWMTQPLYSKSYQQCSHATLLRVDSDTGEASRAVAFDIPAGAFGVLDLQELKFLDSAWTPPSSLAGSKPNSITMPVATLDGRLVCIGTRRRALSLYRMRGVRSRSRPIVMPHPREVGVSENIDSLRWVTTGTPSTHRLVIASVNLSTPDNQLVGAAEMCDHPVDTSGKISYLDFGLHVSEQANRPVVVDLDSVAVEDLEEPPAPVEPPMSELEAKQPNHIERRAKAPPTDQTRGPGIDTSNAFISGSTDRMSPSSTSLMGGHDNGLDQQHSLTHSPTIQEDPDIVAKEIKADRRFSMRRVISDTYDQFLANTVRQTTSVVNDVFPRPGTSKLMQRRIPTQIWGRAKSTDALNVLYTEEKAAPQAEAPTAYVSARQSQEIGVALSEEAKPAQPTPETLEGGETEKAKASVIHTTVENTPKTQEAPSEDTVRGVTSRRRWVSEGASAYTRRLSLKLDDLTQWIARENANNSPEETGPRPKSMHISTFGKASDMTRPMTPPPPIMPINPEAPSPEQIASLHRRHNSYAPQVVPRYNYSAPRAAAGAQRRVVSSYGAIQPSGYYAGQRTPVYASQISLVSSIPEESYANNLLQQHPAFRQESQEHFRQESQEYSNGTVGVDGDADRAQYDQEQPQGTRLATIKSVATLTHSSARSKGSKVPSNSGEEAQSVEVTHDQDPDPMLEKNSRRRTTTDQWRRSRANVQSWVGDLKDRSGRQRQKDGCSVM